MASTAGTSMSSPSTASSSPVSSVLAETDRFVTRHLGPNESEQQRMLQSLGRTSLDALIDATVPTAIRLRRALDLPAARSEREAMDDLAAMARQNQVVRPFLGLGYHNCITPPVILRNILENPGWYTQYTPYQAEISQGRLEALLHFQTLVCDLTGLPVANSSLLDEATAAAEAMTLCKRSFEGRESGDTFFVASHCHPQTIDVVRTRAAPLGLHVVVGDPATFQFTKAIFGALIQYPSTDGVIEDPSAFVQRAHAAGALVVVASDLLALTLLKSPGELGADVAIGNSQRFGVPLFGGGPHAAFMSTRTELQRKLPGRLVGVSKDGAGKPALRLALQTREQHIRRDRATSNICTAQVLLSVTAAMYAIYHGPDGLTRIAQRVHRATAALAAALRAIGCKLAGGAFFDTLRVTPSRRPAKAVHDAAAARGILLRAYDHGDVGIALDETVTAADLSAVFACFGGRDGEADFEALAMAASPKLPAAHARSTPFMTAPVFAQHRTETELLRFIKRLEARDLSLTTSMIPLGSCTMKLNAAAEMYPISDPGFAAIHPFQPAEQQQGYRTLFTRLERWLAEITGFAATSLQPNAGSQGEYAGLLVIAAYHAARGESHRNVCLIPASAHGTNPASAALAGMEIVAVACDAMGNIDVADLKAKATEQRAKLACLMVTYPSTHGVFEEGIKEICAIVHENGGQVYLDGANMNALVGLARPGDIGADVCHLNLHKTFCIPHGGGGPGMGPICVAAHLAPHLPGHPVIATGGPRATGAVSAAPFGSAGILPIPYAYIAMMGPDGLALATKVAILSANYIAKRLDPHFPVLYRGKNGCVAHECIVDLRPITESSGVTAEDVAKRLMDYGFHAPTLSFPVAGTLMIEPTESENLAEIDRLCDALIAIRAEIRAVEEGKLDRKNNPLKNAPHTMAAVVSSAWDRPYSREQAAFPAPWTREHKFWPFVGRVDNVFGDRNLVCCWVPELFEAGRAN
ncbi:MAG: glycine dehydrogenase (aminomethyl-transferring) [Planctomycetes bacterium]|nr:glycine dehydrogenase (aminomethyl-transferring) [Planctomycetota bacterium]